MKKIIIALLVFSIFQLGYSQKKELKTPKQLSLKNYLPRPLVTKDRLQEHM